jgi:hypothetical protein
VEEEG